MLEMYEANSCFLKHVLKQVFGNYNDTDSSLIEQCISLISYFYRDVKILSNLKYQLINFSTNLSITGLLQVMKLADTF